MMKTGTLTFLILNVIILLTWLLPSDGATSGQRDFQRIAEGISQANKLGEECKGQVGCLGKPVTVVLKGDIMLSEPLPPLSFSAYVIIKGACTRKRSRCVIDGQLKYTVFSRGLISAASRLEIYNIVFQNANQGVLPGLNAEVRAQNCIFRNNINGVIYSSGLFGGDPPQTYIRCRFINNNGTAINAGNGKYGLANNNIGFTVKDSSFYYNYGGGNSDDGGAVSLAGFGKSLFQNVQFVGNTAVRSGGAVFADETDVRFQNVLFKGNVALSGVGGAVAGQSGFYRSLQASFCSSSFFNNSAPTNTSTNSLALLSVIPQDSPNTVTVAFCSTPIPPGSVIASAPQGTVLKGTGSGCSAKHC